MLQNVGLVFDTHPAHVDEDAVKDSLLAARAPLRDVADALAELKALKVFSSQSDATGARRRSGVWRSGMSL